MNARTLDAVETDAEGYLRRRDDWSAELAEAMAADDGIALGAPHWEVIEFLQEYYDHYEVAPAIRILTKQIGKRFGQEKGNTKYLYSLFPRGPAKQACRYAGLPKPTGCI